VRIGSRGDESKSNASDAEQGQQSSSSTGARQIRKGRIRRQPIGWRRIRGDGLNRGLASPESGDASLGAGATRVDEAVAVELVVAVRTLVVRRLGQLGF